MPCGRGGNHTFGRAGFAAHHQVVTAQVEALERHGHQGQQRAVGAAERVEEGGRDLVPPQFGAQRPWVQEKREDVGVGQQTAEGVEALFPAAPVQQPVMHDRGLHDTYHDSYHDMYQASYHSSR